MVKIAALLLLIFISLGPLAAQDTLPKFSVTTQGKGRNIVSWNNNYKVVTQISIQRSQDSTKNFRTILSVPDPSIPQNGFVDTKSPTAFAFYRLFIVLDSGRYVFTESKRPFWDTAKVAAAKAVTQNNGANAKRVIISDSMSNKEAEKLRDKLVESTKPANDTATSKPARIAEPEKFFIVKRRDSIILQVSEKTFKPFRDSVIYKTKDTMVFKTADTIVIKPFVPKEVYRPSRYVYTERDGNVSISLPEATSRVYSVKFFDDKDNPLFEISRVKENSLLIDKSNFLSSGWFRFELYEDGKLKEKNKFFIPKDF
jgi:hypothetical protein